MLHAQMPIDIPPSGPRRTLRSVTRIEQIYIPRQTGETPLTDSLTKPIACGGIFSSDQMQRGAVFWIFLRKRRDREDGSGGK